MKSSISPSTEGIFPYVMGVRPAPPRFRLDFAFIKTVPMRDDVMILFWHWSFHIVDDYQGTPRFQEISQESSDLMNIFEMVKRCSALYEWRYHVKVFLLDEPSDTVEVFTHDVHIESFIV